MGSKRTPLLWLVALVFIVGGLLAAGVFVRNAVGTTFSQEQAVRDTRTVLFATLKAQLDEETGIRGFLATGDPAFLQPYETGRSHIPALFSQLSSDLAALQLPAAVASVADAKAANEAWLAGVADASIAQRGHSSLATQQRGKKLVDRFRADVNAIDAGLATRNDSLKSDFATYLIYLGVLVVAAALLLTGAGMLFVAVQTRALHTIEREREAANEVRVRERLLEAAYEAEKGVTHTLQQAFNQRMLPSLPSISFSATYMPAAEEAKVGGDWYDAFEIGSNRILFVIGDIAGHGLDAAVAMSRVRNDVLSAAILDADPASILQRVNARMLSQEVRGPLVTAVVGIADAANYTYTYATAGHPPPILVEPERAPRPLEFGGLALGATGKIAYKTRIVQSVPGAMLVLYTDGVVEHSRDIVAGERELLQSISAIPAGADPATAVYQSIFSERKAGDDVAILTIGFKTRSGSGMTVSAEDGTKAFVGRLDAKRASSSITQLRRAS